MAVGGLTSVINVLSLPFPREDPGGPSNGQETCQIPPATIETSLSATLWAQVSSSANKSIQESTFRAARLI